MDSITHALMATLTPMSLQAATAGGTLNFTYITHSLFQLTMPKTPEAASIPSVTWPQAPQRLISQFLKWGTAPVGESEHGPRVIAYKQCHYGFPLQRAGAKHGAHIAAKWCPGSRGHKRGWGLPCNHSLCAATDSQGQFTGIRAWGPGRRRVGPPHLHGGLWGSDLNLSAQVPGVLLYPLQLLTSNVPLATILGMSATAQLCTIAERELALATSIPSGLEMSMPQVGTKHWHHSSDLGVSTPRQDEEEAADVPE